MKCKKGFKKVEGKCVKSNGPFRVAYEVPTNFGFEKTDVKIFNSLSKANLEFNKRLKEFRKDISKGEFEDQEGLLLEDLSSDLRIQSRIVDEDGELQDYGGMR